MAWRNIVITKHSKISAKMNHLVILTDDDSFQLPLDDVAIIVVETTRAVITTHAMSECLARNIKLIFCDSKGSPIGESLPYKINTNRVANIRKQFQWDQKLKDMLWQRIVQEKITHQAYVLSEIDCEDAEAVRKLASVVTAGDMDNREAVAAHMYFPRLFTYEFVRGDDSNPVNALLNYGYSIILSETCRQVAQYGYLSELGIHHDNDKNPFNLACDLMEPFRPYADKRIYELEEKELNPETKVKLVELLRDEIPEQNTNLSHLIELYVRDSLRYLDGSGKLPELGFIQ